MRPEKRTAPGLATGGGDETPSGGRLLGVEGNRPPPILVSSASSREVSWSAAHEALWPVVARALRAGPLPLVGTHDWLALADGDPRRVGSVWLAADLYALDLENAQRVDEDAAGSVSAVGGWGERGRRQAHRAAFLREHPWAAKRVSA